MSEVYLRSIRSSTGGSIELASGTAVIAPGSVLQIVVVRTNAFTSYSSPTGNGSINGTSITDLNLVITPKKADSMLIMQWMMNGEVNHDNVFLIHKNGTLITDAGYEGVNSVVAISPNRWQGYVPANYENDTNSTAACYFIQYATLAGSTTQQTFCPGTRSSSAATHTFFQNRTAASAGAAAYENMVSTGRIMEISSE